MCVAGRLRLGPLLLHERRGDRRSQSLVAAAATALAAAGAAQPRSVPQRSQQQNRRLLAKRVALAVRSPPRPGTRWIHFTDSFTGG